jgi:hypothetical protein
MGTPRFSVLCGVLELVVLPHRHPAARRGVDDREGDDELEDRLYQ